MAGFSVRNGQILTPAGQPWLAGGINVNDDQIGTIVTGAALLPLLNCFPGLGLLRINCRSYSNGPSFYAKFVEWCAAQAILMIFEDHNGVSAPPLTGAALQAELAFYAALARGFKDNPYVAFGTFNEPGNGTNLAGITAQEVAIYNTIRGANSDALVLMELPSGGNPGLVGAQARGYDNAGPMPPSAYAQMTNIVWDLHYYGWGSKFSTDQATVNQALTGSVASATGILGAQSITSADGVVPVIIGETGNSTNGTTIDANADQVLAAVASSGLSYAVWAWDDADVPGDKLTDQSQLTSFGRQVAAMIAQTAKQAAPPPANPVPGPAAAVGYTNCTFGEGGLVLSTATDPATSFPVIGTDGSNIAPFAFFGNAWKSDGSQQTGGTGGPITLDGTGEAYGDGICTAVPGNPNLTKDPAAWTGIAFGGGGYFEAIMAFTGPASFWANDIENMNRVSLGLGPAPWPGQPEKFGSWVEVDMAEFDSTGVYGFAIHHWYGEVGSGLGVSTIGSGSPARMAVTPDYTKPNKYGWLWVPATPTTQGYGKWFFNDVQVGNTITWDLHDPGLAPPPTQQAAQAGGGSAYAVLDEPRHLAIIFGGAQGVLNTIFGLQVWQASAAGNLINGAAPAAPPPLAVAQATLNQVLTTLTGAATSLAKIRADLGSL
jgi:hypothetical protein